jgi:hypothetical protein
MGTEMGTCPTTGIMGTMLTGDQAQAKSRSSPATTDRASALPPVERLMLLIAAREYARAQSNGGGSLVASLLPSASDAAWLNQISTEHRLRQPGQTHASMGVDSDRVRLRRESDCARAPLRASISASAFGVDLVNFALRASVRAESAAERVDRVVTSSAPCPAAYRQCRARRFRRRGGHDRRARQRRRRSLGDASHVRSPQAIAGNTLTSPEVPRGTQGTKKPVQSSSIAVIR